MAALGETPANRATPGRNIGRYELLEALGRGGMGTVYKARQARLEKLVALKVLDPVRAGRQGAMSRFWREARAAAQIRHPNVVEVFDVGFDDGEAFLVMELLEGQDLAAHLKARGRLELHEAIEVIAPVLAGVRAAHEAGVVHRDLKPSNIFLARRGRTSVSPVVLDFGVSRLLYDEELGLASATSADALIGTAAYVSPEQARQSRLADDRSDQYALGVILYECVTGQRPFTGGSTYELLHAIATAPVLPPSRLNPALPEGFDEVALRALARDPERRYADLEEFAGALLAFAAPRTWMVWARELLAERTEDETLSPATAPPSQPRPSVPENLAASRWNPLVAFAMGVVFSAGSIAFALFTGRTRPDQAALPPPSSARTTTSSAVVPVAPSVTATAALPASSASVPLTVPIVPSSQPPLRARRAVAPPSSPVELGPNDAPILN